MAISFSSPSARWASGCGIIRTSDALRVRLLEQSTDGVLQASQLLRLPIDLPTLFSLVDWRQSRIIAHKTAFAGPNRLPRFVRELNLIDAGLAGSTTPSSQGVVVLRGAKAVDYFVPS